MVILLLFKKKMITMNIFDYFFSFRRSGMESGMCNDNSDSQFLASKKLVRPKWRVGVIPGGSTDAVATTLHGTNDIITATLHIIIGDDRNVDISRYVLKDELLQKGIFFSSIYLPETFY
jgi:hypothetical protein